MINVNNYLMSCCKYYVFILEAFSLNHKVVTTRLTHTHGVLSVLTELRALKDFRNLLVKHWNVFASKECRI